MSSTFTNYFGNLVLQRYMINGTARWLALFTASPTAAGSFSDEVAGGSYVRQRYLSTSPTARAVGNSDGIIFDNMPPCTVTHMGVCDAQYSGNLLLWGACTPLVVPDSGRLRIAANDIVWTI